MFDTAKVQRMTAELETFARERYDIYVIPKFLSLEAFSLFHRLQLQIRAILTDGLQQQEISGLPIMKTAEASTNFNERTRLIVLTKKPMPMIQTTFDFEVNSQWLKIPAFLISSEEILAVYDRLMVSQYAKEYLKDGCNASNLYELATHFARGLTTFLEPNIQTFKFQFWDRSYFIAPTYDIDDTAIVLRGQIVQENHYTESMLEFYRSIYPNTPIIVSTWKTEITNSFREVCKKNSVVLLENIQPTLKTWANLNYQLENAFKGVDYVKKNLGTKFVLVTRTDQRIDKFDFLQYFRNLILQFPPFGDKLRGRILSLGSWLASKYTPFHITDFLLFGFTSDVFKVYDFPHLDGLGEFKYFSTHRKFFGITREKLISASYKKCNFSECGKKLKQFNVVMDHFVITDIFWMKNFYRRHIAPLDRTKLLETWWEFMQQYLLFVEINSVVFDWPKHENVQRYSIFARGTDFSQWLDMYRKSKAD